MGDTQAWNLEAPVTGSLTVSEYCDKMGALMVEAVALASHERKGGL
jgi:hypothetical protein